MYPRQRRTTAFILTIFIAAFGAGCTALNQPTFRPVAKEERDRLRNEYRLDVLASIRRGGEPECTAKNKWTYAEVREFVDRHTLVAQDNGDIEGERSESFEEKFLRQFTAIMTAFEEFATEFEASKKIGAVPDNPFLGLSGTAPKYIT